MTWARPTETQRRQMREDEKNRRMRSLLDSMPCARGVYAGSTGAASPKTIPKRNRALLDMAKGRPCLLCAPGFCTCTSGSVVACHSNLSIHGKAKGRKADDHYSVWGGAEAHKALDRGAGSRDDKAGWFMRSHLRQVHEWRIIATDPSEPARFRKAALWALEQLGATPPGAAP